jgi:hypothetical protein
MASGRWLARRCMAMRRGPTPVTHEPGTVSGMCFADTSCPWPPAFPPPTPQPRPGRCSPASSVLRRSPTSAARTSSAATSSASPTRTAARHRRRPVDRSPGSRTKSFCACQGLGPRGGDGMLAMAHVAVLPSIRATMSAPRTVCLSRLNLLAYTLPYRRFAAPSRNVGARLGGHCGSLLLQRRGLPPPTLCRSPGARRGRDAGYPAPPAQ